MIQTKLGLLLVAINAASCLNFGHDVIELTSSNFNPNVVDSEDLWLVLFCAPGNDDCTNLAPTYGDVATKLKGKVKVGAIDVDNYQDLGAEYEVSVFPTIKSFGEDKTNPTDYEGPLIKKKLIKAGLKMIVDRQRNKEKAEEEASPPRSCKF